MKNLINLFFKSNSTCKKNRIEIKIQSFTSIKQEDNTKTILAYRELNPTMILLFSCKKLALLVLLGRTAAKSMINKII